MHSLEVCVGSSCHLKGAYDVIKELKQLIADNGLQDRVELKACFCMNHCIEGVNIRFDDTVFSGLTRDETARFFTDNVLTRINTCEKD
jgi:NADH:ubiquinone oxidoreductase subunit E